MTNKNDRVKDNSIPLRGRFPRSSRSAPHPGAFLESRFLEPLNITQSQLALALGVSRRRINELIVGKRSITTDTAIRLACFFKTEPEFWLMLQMRWDLHVVLEKEAEKSLQIKENKESAH